MTHKRLVGLAALVAVSALSISVTAASTPILDLDYVPITGEQIMFLAVDDFGSDTGVFTNPYPDEMVYVISACDELRLHDLRDLDMFDLNDMAMLSPLNDPIRRPEVLPLRLRLGDTGDLGFKHHVFDLGDIKHYGLGGTAAGRAALAV